MKRKLNFELKLSHKIIIIVASLFLALTICFCIRRNCVLNHNHFKNLTEQQQKKLSQIIAENNYERNNLIHNLPYSTKPVDLKINALSAILVNCDTGDILYEKNADELIPPASMTKLFLMYAVHQKIAEGKISLDTIIPLPPECWASNMPPRSSLMFLGKDQIVTLKELMIGLAVCSGNDASHAIAYYLFGSIENFIEEVNKQIKLCGLEKTKIVEPSGYSENNVTTAKEMAIFSRIYLTKYPESLELFHSVKKITYPLPHNVPLKDKDKPLQDFKNGFPDSIWTPIEQESTNKLLKKLDGCDGLKTGYIDESGYNLSLTCKRNGERYISVTMKGPGKGIVEGDKFRQQDGITLQEFAFNTFFESEENSTYEFISVLGAKEGKIKIVVPYSMKTCIPKLKDKNENVICKQDLRYEYFFNKFYYGKIFAGQNVGTVKLMYNDFVFEEAPLLADRDVDKSNIFLRALDWLVFLSIR